MVSDTLLEGLRQQYRIRTLCLILLTFDLAVKDWLIGLLHYETFSYEFEPESHCTISSRADTDTRLLGPFHYMARTWQRVSLNC